MSDTDTERRLLTTQQAADYLGFSEGTLRQDRIKAAPKFPTPSKIGSAVRYDIRDLDTWIEASKKGASNA